MGSAHGPARRRLRQPVSRELSFPGPRRRQRGRGQPRAGQRRVRCPAAALADLVVPGHMRLRGVRDPLRLAPLPAGAAPGRGQPEDPNRDRPARRHRAGLSQIAILSEVAQRSAGASLREEPPLSDIAGISRELVDSMSDIVWAINPEHDRMSNLVHRMRRFATDVLGGQKIGVRFHSSVTEDDLKLAADVRRQLYLIFKESIHNVVRHSGVERGRRAARRWPRRLTLRVDRRRPRIRSGCRTRGPRAPQHAKARGLHGRIRRDPVGSRARNDSDGDGAIRAQDRPVNVEGQMERPLPIG